MEKFQNEKEDLAEPLPEWTKEDLKDVVMHGDPSGSPPCLKIVSILKHNDVKFKVIKGAKKDSKYKKVPEVLGILFGVHE